MNRNRRLLLALGILVIGSTAADALPRRYTSAGANFDTGRSVTTDPATGDVYVVGTYTQPGRDKDILVIKYNSAGVYIWGRVYGSVQEDVGTDALFANGRIYATGYVQATPGHKSLCVISFDPAGGGFLSRTITPPGDGVGKELARDAAGNIYVGGTGVYPGTAQDFLIAKFSPTLLPLWSNRWGANGEDVFKSMVVGNGVYVCGSRTNAGQKDAVVGRLVNATGAVMNARVLPGIPFRNDEANDILSHPATGDVVVLTTRFVSPLDSHLVTFRLSANLAAIGWTNVFNPNLLVQQGVELGMTPSSIVVAGTTDNGSNNDYCIYALDPTAGAPVIAPIYYDPGGEDVLVDMVVSGNDVYVTGDSDGFGGNDAATLRITAAGVAWAQRYHFVGDDNANCVAIAPNGNVLVCGGSDGAGTGKDLFTGKLNQVTGANIW